MNTELFRHCCGIRLHARKRLNDSYNATLGGAYDEGGASPVGQHGHVTHVVFDFL